MSKQLSLKDVHLGHKATVLDVDCKGHFCDRLLELGLLPGTEFEVTKVAPFGDPVEIAVRGSTLCLRKSECSCIKVTLSPDSETAASKDALVTK